MIAHTLISSIKKFFFACSSVVRAKLKEQLELWEPPQKQFVKRVGETLEMAERTRQEESRERDRDAKHRQFLCGFKETNKVVSRLETSWSVQPGCPD